jgi:pimeloyl-ACP methyl ester carboxylesterase
MARYHDNVDAAFFGWADVWLHPDFERWELSEEITRLRASTLLIQGINDQYATLEQLDRIQNDAAAAPIQRLELQCQHSPHLEAPDETLTAIATFTKALD